MVLFLLRSEDVSTVVDTEAIMRGLDSAVEEFYADIAPLIHEITARVYNETEPVPSNFFRYLTPIPDVKLDEAEILREFQLAIDQGETKAGR